jgi:two-component system, OmpR family, alkaline phosphatase synthesis response regulator PhoP
MFYHGVSFGGGTKGSETMTRVLVVDDERVIRDLLRFGLEIEGYEVVTLPDGRAVVETLRALREPCVVLMDLMKTGWDVCQELERESALRRHPLAIMTASLQAGDTPPSPARRLIPKPFLLDDVLHVVEALAAESAAPVAHLAPVQSPAPHAVAR